MERLTLNVLLSFAQFEREVTGERIRDKIAASKRRGMWMGGTPPLGYDVADRKLVVNEEEAKRVCHIFERYIELGAVSKLRDELRRNRVLGKRWTSARGTYYSGRHFSHSGLYRLLANRTYRGEIKHHEKIYPGEHKAIVVKDIWEQAQKVLAKNRRRRSRTDPNRPR